MSFRHNEDAVVAMWAEARRKMEGVAEEKAVEFETKRRAAIMDYGNCRNDHPRVGT